MLDFEALNKDTFEQMEKEEVKVEKLKADVLEENKAIDKKIELKKNYISSKASGESVGLKSSTENDSGSSKKSKGYESSSSSDKGKSSKYVSTSSSSGSGYGGSSKTVDAEARKSAEKIVMEAARDADRVLNNPNWNIFDLGDEVKKEEEYQKTIKSMDEKQRRKHIIKESAIAGLYKVTIVIGKSIIESLYLLSNQHKSSNSRDTKSKY